MSTMQVFVSHSHEDDAFCRGIVAALRDAGADVWYDEHNLGAGQLMEVIQRELDHRPVFVLILSKHAFASKWVKRETTWAYHLMDRDPTRILLPVTGGQIEHTDFSGTAGWLFLTDFRRIEAPGLKPFPVEEAAGRLLHALALTAAGEVPAVQTPQPSESADDLVAKGKALIAQNKHSEAIPFLERATQLDPRSFDAWACLGWAYVAVDRYVDALTTSDRALELDDKQAWVWNNKGVALLRLKRYEEALVACDRALGVNPNYAPAWNNKGNALDHLIQKEEALVAYDRALAYDPNYAYAWWNKGGTLGDLNRFDEAFAAYDCGLALDPTNASAWKYKAKYLRRAGREAEAREADRRAKESGAPDSPQQVQLAQKAPTAAPSPTVRRPQTADELVKMGRDLLDHGMKRQAVAVLDRATQRDAGNFDAWAYLGRACFQTRQYILAIVAINRALGLNENLAWVWYDKGVVFNRLKRYEEALAAYDRALAINGYYAAVWHKKAITLRALGRVEEADEAEQRAKSFG